MRARRAALTVVSAFTCLGAASSGVSLASSERDAQRPRRVTLMAPAFAPSDHPISLYGTAEGAAPGDEVEIQSKDCGTTFFRGVSATHTQRGGLWSAEFYPGITTWVRAVWRGHASTPARVRQQVRLELVQKPFKPRIFETSVVARAQFWRKKVVIERYRAGERRWRPFRAVVLTTQRAPGQIVWTSGEFTARLPTGTRLRASLPASQAGPCYMAGTSLVLTTR